MNFVPLIRATFHMNQSEDGRLLEIDSGESFMGTQGEFLEKIQHRCMEAYLKGQYDAYRIFLEHHEMPCLVCEKKMKLGDLHEDVCMCNECFYG